MQSRLVRVLSLGCALLVVSEVRAQKDCEKPEWKQADSFASELKYGDKSYRVSLHKRKYSCKGENFAELSLRASEDDSSKSQSVVKNISLTDTDASKVNVEGKSQQYVKLSKNKLLATIDQWGNPVVFLDVKDSPTQLKSLVGLVIHEGKWKQVTSKEQLLALEPELVGKNLLLKSIKGFASAGSRDLVEFDYFSFDKSSLSFVKVDGP